MAEVSSLNTLGNQSGHGTQGVNRLAARQRAAEGTKNEIAAKFERDAAVGRARAAARTGRSGPAYGKSGRRG